MSIKTVLEQVAQYQPRYVCVTGGEPLAQPNCLLLLERLAEQGYEVSLETSGALDVSGVDSRVVKVMDLKTPGSGEVSRNRYRNIHYLDQKDQIKFVIADRDDYDWSVSKLVEYDLANRVSDVLLSPVSDGVEPDALAGWILEDRLPVRFSTSITPGDLGRQGRRLMGYEGVILWQRKKQSYCCREVWILLRC